MSLASVIYVTEQGISESPDNWQISPTYDSYNTSSSRFLAFTAFQELYHVSALTSSINKDTHRRIITAFYLVRNIIHYGKLLDRSKFVGSVRPSFAFDIFQFIMLKELGSSILASYMQSIKDHNKTVRLD